MQILHLLQRHQLPDGLIAQLVEHCTGIAEVKSQIHKIDVYHVGLTDLPINVFQQKKNCPNFVAFDL